MIRQLTEPDDASQRHCNQLLCLEPGTQSCSPFPVSPHLVGCLATRKLAASCGAPYHSYHAICLKRCDGHHHQRHQSRAQDCGWLKWASACTSSWNRHFLVKQPDGLTAFGGPPPLAELNMKSGKATEGLSSPPLSSPAAEMQGGYTVSSTCVLICVRFCSFFCSEWRLSPWVLGSFLSFNTQHRRHCAWNPSRSLLVTDLIVSSLISPLPLYEPLSLSQRI